MSNTHVVVIAVLLCRGLAWGQDASDPQTIRDLVQEVRELKSETQQLRDELLALKAQQTSVQATSQAAAPASEATPVEGSLAPTQPETTFHSLYGIRWQGFGEVHYKVLDQRQPELGTYGFVPGSAGNFYTGDFDLFLHSRLSDRTSVQADVVFQEVDAQSYKLDMRQALLKIDWSEHLKLAFGRYQTAIGYYNTAFRSAAWLQTTADRPLVMEYASNGGLLPTQAVGVSITGAIPSGKLGLSYIGEYGSSDTIRPDISGSGLFNDENDGNHALVGIVIRPDWLSGLQGGSSFFHDKISDSVVSVTDRFGQSILNTYVVYSGHKVESLNEAFLIRQTQLVTGRVFNTPAFYTQISRQWGLIRPFFRYQYVNASSLNTIYDDVGLRAGPSFGARYDPTSSVALKAQLDHTQRRGLPDLNGLHLQVAFTF